MQRRAFLATASALAMPAIASAQGAWPNRPVRVIVPFSPGGASDIIIRPVAERLSQRFGQNFIVENRAGGGGAVGVAAAVAERPDGHTLLVTTPPPSPCCR